MVVQHNISAMTANRYYGVNNKGLASSLEKLASGYAINRAGDNAAGLAVSEKMRAQIGGLTQASKNAEDGISLVQTFEGALQETDSILQRMRTLAVQSANGSYQDDVDREAMQLEFDQLNDELNQIADTDFNGVVMLNGGQMADGLKAVDGKFDYANKAGQVITEARDKSISDLKDAAYELNTAKAAFNGTKFDLSENGTTREYNTIDNNNYTKTEADALWKKLGLTKDGTTTGVADTSKVHSVAITFEKDGDSWKAVKGYDQNGNKLDQDKVETIATTTATVTDATGKGGFSVDGTNVNAIFDATKAKDGDTYTVIFTNDDKNIYAPTNTGFDLDSVSVSDDASGIVNTDLKVSLTGGTTDYALNPEDDTDVTTITYSSADTEVNNNVKAAYTALENSIATTKYTAGEETVTDDTTDPPTTAITGGTAEFSLRASGTTEEDEPFVKFDISKTATDSEKTFNIKDDNGNDVEVTARYSSKNGTVTLSTKGNTEGTEFELMTFTIQNGAAEDANPYETPTIVGGKNVAFNSDGTVNTTDSDAGVTGDVEHGLTVKTDVGTVTSTLAGDKTDKSAGTITVGSDTYHVMVNTTGGNVTSVVGLQKDDSGDPDGNAVSLASLGLDASIGDDGKTITVTKDVTYTATAGTGKITFTNSEDDTDTAELTVSDGAAGIDSSLKDGTITATVSASTSSYAKANNVTAYAGDDDKLGNSSAALDRLNKAQAKYDEAVADNRSIQDLASAKAFLNKGSVSESDTFDQSRATMSYTDSMTLQVGARTKDAVNFTFSYQSNGLGDLKANLNCSARTDGLGTADLSIADQKSANEAIDKIDNALNKVNMVRATFGAAQNRLEHKINNIDTNTENLTAAESRIRDTQMDKEMMKFTSAQILSQASQSMLAQANQLPQGVLQLLG